MKTSFSVRTCVSLVLVVLCLFWWVITTVIYAYLPVVITKPVLFDAVLGYGLLFSLCAHLALLYTTLPESGKYSGLRNGTLFLGVLSFSFLFYDWLSLNEMENEYESGYPWAGMAKMLWTMQGFHLLYYAVALVLFLRLRRLSQTPQNAGSSNGYARYRSLNMAGIACGLNGTLPLLLFMVVAHRMNRFYSLHAVFVFAFGFFMLPYILVWIPWMVKTFRQPSDKQLMSHIYKASAVSLAFTFMLILALLVGSLINSPINSNLSFTNMNVNLLWLPLMLFAGLLVFSVGGLVVGRFAASHDHMPSA